MNPHQLHPLHDPAAPDLRIAAIASLVEHEFNDAQRTRPLAQRLAAEGQLKNPPVVTPMGSGDPRLVVLDGANRVTALKSLGLAHILVQVVPYQEPQVTLSTWHHLVTDIDLESFSTDLRRVAGLEFRQVDLLHARAGLARRDYIAYVVRADGQVAAAESARADIRSKNALLNAMVDTYKEQGGLYRATTDDLAEARRLYPNLTGLIIFPKYEPSEVIALARDGQLLPTGLTRHLIQGRALRVNYPLEELQAADSLEDKNARLGRWLQQKLTAKDVRYYAEATYLFDE